MRRNIVTALFVFAFFLLQSTLFQSVTLGGVAPNLLIILTSAYGFMCGKKHGLMVGFFCGLLYDIFFGQVVGFYALIYMYIGFCNGFFHEFFFKEDIKLPLALVVISDFVYDFMLYCLLFLLRGRFQVGFYMTHIILPEMVYTILTTIFIYPVLLWINRKFDAIEKRSAKKFV